MISYEQQAENLLRDHQWELSVDQEIATAQVTATLAICEHLAKISDNISLISDHLSVLDPPHGPPPWRLVGGGDDA